MICVAYNVKKRDFESYIFVKIGMYKLLQIKKPEQAGLKNYYKGS